VQNAPRWQPATIASLEMGAVAAHFAPLGSQELMLGG
jgi:hypothetical protein